MHLIEWLSKQTDERQLKSLGREKGQLEQAHEGQVWGDSGSDLPHKEKGLVQLPALWESSRVWLSAVIWGIKCAC